MHPVLFDLGALRVPSYGSMLVLGFLVGLALCRRLAATSGIEPQLFTELVCWLVIGGGVGSRLAFVIQHQASAPGTSTGAFEIWRGGAVWYGGVLGGLAALVACRRCVRLPLWRVGDVLMPGLALAHAAGRVGCFLAGCCFGRPSGVPWAVTFPEEGLCRTPGIPVHPTQLYEAGGELVVCGLLLSVLRRRHLDGDVFLAYFALYPALRLAVEPLRGDLERGLAWNGPFTFAQLTSALVFACAVTLLAVRRRFWTQDGVVRPVSSTGGSR